MPDHGRLELDEPTDLPEGTVVPREIADDWDKLDASPPIEAGERVVPAH